MRVRACVCVRVCVRMCVSVLDNQTNESIVPLLRMFSNCWNVLKAT